MNLNKHREFFDPEEIKDPIHIIGVGAIGSNIVNQLVRLGFTDINIHDFDKVSEHNLTNQLFNHEDIGEYKTEAVSKMANKINPKIKLGINNIGWNKETNLTGHVILAVDSIELRKQILEQNQNNVNIKSFSDYRMGLEEAQHYFADPSSSVAVTKLLNTMNFKDDEQDVVVSACGTTLSVLPTIQSIVSFGVMNLLKFIKTNDYNWMILVDSSVPVVAKY